MHGRGLSSRRPRGTLRHPALSFPPTLSFQQGQRSKALQEKSLDLKRCPEAVDRALVWAGVSWFFFWLMQDKLLTL